MFYPLSKILDLAFAPLTWALALLALGALLRRRGRVAWVLEGAAVLVLLAFSTPRIAGVIQRATESGARATFRPDVVYDAVIVLGGILDVDAVQRTGEFALMDEADRLLRAFELWRTGHVRYILLSGGSGPGVPPEAEQLRVLLVRWGVPQDAIVVEPRSLNTHENAVETARVVAARDLRTLLLVTSAFRIPRALGCFRRVGLQPDVLPADHRGEEDGGWQPRAAALEQSTSAIRELVGRVVYRVMGYTR